MFGARRLMQRFEKASGVPVTFDSTQDQKAYPAFLRLIADAVMPRYPGMGGRLAFIADRLAYAANALRTIEREITGQIAEGAEDAPGASHPAARAVRELLMERDRLRGEVEQWERGDRLPIESRAAVPVAEEREVREGAHADAKRCLEEVKRLTALPGYVNQQRADVYAVGALVLQALANQVHIGTAEATRKAEEARRVVVFKGPSDLGPIARAAASSSRLASISERLSKKARALLRRIGGVEGVMVTRGAGENAMAGTLSRLNLIEPYLAGRLSSGQMWKATALGRQLVVWWDGGSQQEQT